MDFRDVVLFVCYFFVEVFFIGLLKSSGIGNDEVLLLMFLQVEIFFLHSRDCGSQGMVVVEKGVIKIEENDFRRPS